MPTNVELANRALAEIGTRSKIVTLGDATQPESLYAGILYTPFRDFLLRKDDYDFAMKQAVLTAAGTVIAPWTRTYAYPSDCLRIRSLLPFSYDALDPLPIEWNELNVANVIFIVSKQDVGNALYTFAANENQWDAMFQETFVRFLGAGLMFALRNGSTFSGEMINQAILFADANMARQP